MCAAFHIYPYISKFCNFKRLSNWKRHEFKLTSQLLSILMIHVGTALMKVHVITLISLHFRRHFTSTCNIKTRYSVWKYKRK
jgi:hypothetical protein